MADIYAGIQILRTFEKILLNENMRVIYYCQYILTRFSLVAVEGNGLLKGMAVNYMII